MRISVLAPILNLDGSESGKTLREVVCSALLAQMPGDEQMPGERKYALFAAAVKVSGGPFVDLDIDEVKLIRDRVDMGYGALVVGRVRDLLDPKPRAVEEPEQDAG